MKEPKIAARHPAVMNLAAGRHAFCICDESQNQPFCDGGHEGRVELLARPTPAVAT